MDKGLICRRNPAWNYESLQNNHPVVLSTLALVSRGTDCCWNREKVGGSWVPFKVLPCSVLGREFLEIPRAIDLNS